LQLAPLPATFSGFSTSEYCQLDLKLQNLLGEVGQKLEQEMVGKKGYSGGSF
jgi:hypothetical protein